MKESFGAVVLTMNKKTVVISCIKSLMKQNLDKIIVVDNGSKDKTKEYIELQFKKEILNKKIEIISLENNLGSAGGYGVGIKEAILQNIDWIWLFDDDCEALSNSLKILKNFKKTLEKDNTKIAFLSSRHQLLDGGFVPVKIHLKSGDYLKYLDYSAIKLRWTVYTGTLLNANLIKNAGLPRKDMFLYEDDTEFTHRLSQTHEGFLVGNSNILHKDYFSKRTKFTSRDSGLLHRQKFAIRNGVFFSKILFKKNKIEGIFYIASILKNIFFTTLFSKNIAYSPKIFLYFLKGFVFNPKIEKIN